MLQTLPFPLAGTSGGDGARRASHASPTRTPAPVLRGVGIATVAAIAVTGGAAHCPAPVCPTPPPTAPRS